MNFLVTGASGFLGRHLIEALWQSEDCSQIIVLVRDKKSWHQMKWTHKYSNLKVIEGDLLQWEVWGNHKELEKIGGVFHLAAAVIHNRETRNEVFETNVNGAESVLRFAASKTARMVFLSTSGTVGCFTDSSACANENSEYCTEVVQNWPYYASKIEAEKIVKALATELNTQLVILRPPMLLGPGDHRGRSTSQITKFLNGKVPFIIDGGIHYVDIRDVARAVLKAMVIVNPKPIYHLPGTSSTLKEFFASLSLASEKSAPYFILPRKFVLFIAKIEHYLAKLFRRSHAFGLCPDPVVIEMASHYWGMESLFAKNDLNFEPRPGDETLKDTVLWINGE